MYRFTVRTGCTGVQSVKGVQVNRVYRVYRVYRCTECTGLQCVQCVQRLQAILSIFAQTAAVWLPSLLKIFRICIYIYINVYIGELFQEYLRYRER